MTMTCLPMALLLAELCVRLSRRSKHVALAYGYHYARWPTHGYEATREAAMAAFAKSWRRQ